MQTDYSARTIHDLIEFMGCEYRDELVNNASIAITTKYLDDKYDIDTQNRVAEMLEDWGQCYDSDQFPKPLEGEFNEIIHELASFDLANACVDSLWNKRAAKMADWHAEYMKN